VKKLRILHLAGSAVSEFYSNLSCLYAQDCLDNTADVDSYEFYVAYVSPDRKWHFPASLSTAAIAAAQPISISTAISILIDLQVDLVLPQMFCVPGMTEYRSFFDLLQIPYLGNTAAVMALAADKAKTRSVVAAAGVDIPRGELLRRGARPSIELPIVVKPVNADNSLGVTLVESIADLDEALQTALNYTDEVLVEKFIERGREVRCGIIVQESQLVCLPLEEYALSDRQPIRGYTDKLYQGDDGGLNFAAKGNAKSWIVDLNDPITKKVWAMAEKCHVALGCRHYSLFDFRIDPQGNPWFLEAGLYCSFAEHSVLSTMARSAGIPLNEFFHSMLKNALPNDRSV
jgi:D-alanine-D-alanine ligase